MDELEALLIKKYKIPPERARSAAEQIIMQGRVEAAVDRVSTQGGPAEWALEGSSIGTGIASAKERTDSPHSRRSYPASVLEAEALSSAARNEVERMRRLNMFARVYDPEQPDRRDAIQYGTRDGFRQYPEYLTNYEAFMGKPDQRRADLQREVSGIVTRTPGLQSAYEEMMAKSRGR